MTISHGSRSAASGCEGPVGDAMEDPEMNSAIATAVVNIITKLMIKIVFRLQNVLVFFCIDCRSLRVQPIHAQLIHSFELHSQSS
jgi:hypothetical protein